ncbi:protein FAR1-RELATED SEQUENCE 5-like [Jatropha curcas]|uniref:protein FAR1-RELATED SEQUENCE 5-like n=1 Tax=Jatropha curcas TaxID=180498 RepID=UPI0005FA9BCE|nr:protein FAR1-RELATED SEQUENCE 5-like [Jatropha curcas]
MNWVPESECCSSNLESLFKCYLKHAKARGFSVARKSGSKDRGGNKRYYTISCDKGRKPTASFKESKRTDCPAKVSAVLRKNGFWEVTKINTYHNHELETMSSFMHGHRNLDSTMKRKLEANDIAGIRSCKSIKLMIVEAGGPKKMTCSVKDCRNYIEARRRLRLGDGDAESITRMFSSMQLKDRNVFHLVDTDNDGRLRNVIWVHCRIRAAYEEFNDVICFDTTYLVNRYKMLFATIVGVDHHGQSILLGCALIPREDTVANKWNFRNWLAAMGGIAREAIMTISVKFKHIEKFKKAEDNFKGLIYDSLTVEMFETQWVEFLRKHEVESNEWLLKLYLERRRWVPVYLNDTFWGGMRST